MRFRLKSILERAESQRQSKDLCYTRFLSLLFDSLSSAGVGDEALSLGEA